MSVDQWRVGKVFEHFGQSQIGNVKVQCGPGQGAKYHCHGKGGDCHLNPKFNIQCGYP